jgi:hypothetical protein
MQPAISNAIGNHRGNRQSPMQPAITDTIGNPRYNRQSPMQPAIPDTTGNQRCNQQCNRQSPMQSAISDRRFATQHSKPQSTIGNSIANHHSGDRHSSLGSPNRQPPIGNRQSIRP